MAANVKNVLVGAAQLFVSQGTGSNRPNTTVGASGLNWATQKAAGYLDAQTDPSTGWRDLGYTSTGLEVSYEPSYGEVMLKTELSEGTLENINLVFGQTSPIVQYSATTGSSYTLFSPATSTAASSANATLNLSAGALGDAPVERSLIAIGNAPANIGTVASPQDVSSVTKKERVYIARRVVQVEVTSHALKRDTATVFPVQFRCLPDDGDSYDGAEYGVIIDRVYSTL